MASDKPTDDEALALQLHLELNAFTRSTRRAASVISRTSEADARRQAALKELSKSRQEMKSKSLHSDSAKRKRDDVPDGDSSEREGSGDTPDDEDDGSESQGTQHRKVVKRSKPSSEDGQDAAVTKAVSFSGAPFTSQASPTNTSTSEPAKQKQRAEKLGGVATDKAPKKPQVPREKRKTEPEGLVKTEAKHAPGSVRVPDTAGGKAGSMTGHGSPKSKSMMAVKKAVKPQAFTESHGTPTSPGAQRDASQRHAPQQSKAIAAKGRSMADSKDVRKADDSKRQKLPGAGVPDERPGSKPKSSADNKQAARPLGLTAKSNRPAAPKPGVTKASASTVQGAGPRKTSQQPERPTERKGGADAAKPQPKAQMPRAQPQKGQQQDQVGKGSGVHEGETKASASKAALAEAAPGGVKQEQQQKQQLAAEPEGALKAAAPQTQLQRKREVEPEPKVAVSTSCSMPALDSTNPVQQRLESHKAADTGEEARPLLLDRHPQAAVRWLQSQLTQAACKAGGRRGKQQQRSRARGAGYGGSVIKCWFQGIRWGVSLHPSQLKDRPSLASALNDAFQGQILSCGKGAGLHVIFVSRDGRFREFPPTKASDPGADEDWYRAAQAAARVFVSPIQAMLH